MSRRFDKNTYIGYGAERSFAFARDEIVIGSPAATVFLAGDAVAISTQSLTLSGCAFGGAAVAGSYFTSGGPGAAADWQPPSVYGYASAVDTTNLGFPEAYIQSTATGTVTLAAGPPPGAVVRIVAPLGKVTLSGTVIDADANTVAPAETVSGSAFVLVSDGATWYVIEGYAPPLEGGEVRPARPGVGPPIMPSFGTGSIKRSVP